MMDQKMIEGFARGDPRSRRCNRYQEAGNEEGKCTSTKLDETISGSNDAPHVPRTLGFFECSV